jgi:hypothetical protein
MIARCGTEGKRLIAWVLPSIAICCQIPWGIGALADGGLPPLRYDRPYEGHLTIETVANWAALPASCRGLSVRLVACAIRGESVRNGDYCRIYILEHARSDLVLRHEIGHCNGWPGHHPDERPYRALEAKPGAGGGQKPIASVAPPPPAAKDRADWLTARPPVPMYPQIGN